MNKMYDFIIYNGEGEEYETPFSIRMSIKELIRLIQIVGDLVVIDCLDKKTIRDTFCV